MQDLGQSRMAVGCDSCLGRHPQGLPAATEELELSVGGVVVVLGLSLVCFPGIWCWQRGGCPPNPLVLLVLSSSLELLSPALVHVLGTRGTALSEAGSVFLLCLGFLAKFWCSNMQTQSDSKCKWRFVCD